MNRIYSTFKRLKETDKKAFMPYVTFGDPDLKTSMSVVKSLCSAGADIVELGIPFSDPMADGPTVQRAITRALKSGIKVREVFSAVKEIRKTIETPFVFMTYYNIVFAYGPEKFIKDAKKCGADGIIVPDLPMEEADELIDIADNNDFCVVLLAAPTTSPERFRQIAARSRGFIYYVSLTGVTGAKHMVVKNVAGCLKKLKRITSKPVCVGFGISTPSQAKEIAAFADGVIVGSAIINVLEKNLSDRKKAVKLVEKFSSGIAKAVHSV